MGGTHGRIVSPEEARKRFTPLELRTLRSGFDRLASASPQQGFSEIGFMTFKSLVLADFPDFPEPLALRMFSVFDVNRNQALDWNELLCGLCILCRGKHEERLRFLFQVYDDERTGALSRHSLLRFADCLDDHRLSDDERRSSYDLIDKAFARTRGTNAEWASPLTLEAFSRSMVQFMDSPLVSWPTRVGQKLLGPVFMAAAQTTVSDVAECGPMSKLGPPLPPRPDEVESAMMRQAAQGYGLNAHLSQSTGGPFADANLIRHPAFVRHQSSRAQLEEGSTFKRMHRSPDRELLVPGDVWFVVSARWFRAWQAYSGYSHGEVDLMSLRSSRQLERPGPIDNRDIVRGLEPEQDPNDPRDLGELEFCVLRPELNHQQDFVILCRDAWEFLHRTYGGGPVLARKVISAETPFERAEIELFPVSLHVRCVAFSGEAESGLDTTSDRAHLGSFNADRPARIQVSRRATVRDIERAILDRLMEPRGRALSTDSLYSTQSAAAEDGLAQKRAALQNRDRFSAECMRLWCMVDDSLESLSATFSGPEARPLRGPNINAKLLQDPQETVEEADLEDDQTIILELCSADGSWPLASIETLRSLRPRDPKTQIASGPHINARVVMLGGGPSPHNSPTSRASSGLPAIGAQTARSNAKTQLATRPVGGPPSPGRPAPQVLGNVGMANLGNTCFMSASLQCLLHTESLKQYILDDAYVSDVNTTLRDSTHGLLADAFADLFRIAWGANGRIPASIAPRRFKKELSKHDPRFLGVQQQDAQELLSSLLDGLAQDLNRIKSKAYVELKDSDGRADQEVAREWWMAHLRRELSIVTALFSGQFKTLLRCDTCGYESARFEPFSTLSLPLPESPKRTVMVHVVFADASRPPLLVAMRLRKEGNFGDVRRALLDLQPGTTGSVVQSILQGPTSNTEDENAGERAPRNLDSERLVLAYVFERQIFSFVPDARPLKTLRARDPLYAFELPHLHHEDGFSGAAVNLKEAAAAAAAANDDEGDDDNAKEADGEDDDKNAEVDGDIGVTGDPEGQPQQDDEIEIGVGTQVEYHVSDDHFGPMLGVVVGIKGTTSKRQGRLPKYQVKFAADTNDISETRTVVLVSNEVRAVPMRPMLLKLEQRVWHKHACYFVNPMRPVLVGMPFVLMARPDRLSGYALYEAVARQVRQFNGASSPSANAGDEGGALSPGVFESIGASAGLGGSPPTKDVSASQIRSTWGFTIVALGADRQQRTCGSCSWMSACDGCPIQPTSTPVSTIFTGPSTLVVDWGSASSPAGKSRSNALTLMPVDKHSSVDDVRREEQKRMPLSSLLENFVRKEQLTGEDQARCARCKDFKDHSMTLGLWRAPPILVMHLKRFDGSRKLLNLVEYPTRDLDLSPYLAHAMPAQPRKSRRSLDLALRKRGVKADEDSSGDEQDDDDDEEKEDIDDAEPDNAAGVSHGHFVGKESEVNARPSSMSARKDSAVAPVNALEEEEEEEEFEGENGGGHGKSVAAAETSDQTLSPEALAKAEAEEEALELVDVLVDSEYVGLRAYGGHEHGGIPPEYDLYGVVDHTGSLGGGHYIAKTKSSINGKWYNFDDRIITEISEEEAVSSRAYLLFYVRKDVAANADVNRLFPCEFLNSKSLRAARKALDPHNQTFRDRCPIM
ncbi:Ubiquitin carboxyl-terminal hydrolase, putative [Hondaea fermentalgiana]|uniref:Ubiquitin carboxyl-terminal hydrolase, putative n=1 Tax=Hondaea fermentalgiana TaxID=2315210 RepID=A0A2R5G5L9_9STRA|nr:Ubiquitin carboxyl-terminal hydrolase, putative [Hondaea fermentalgiana]|eukprot:GBG26337.1 Ubiquitin carboxyl-terminal hydrolase, putative [Hondaea fermentalgiana]